MCKKLFFLVSFVLVLSVALMSTAKAEIVGWWRLDEGSGTIATDLSEYGNNGTLQGDPQWVNGKFGKALKFDGVDDFVEIPHAEILTVDNEVTVMAWINAERHGGPGTESWQGIVAKSNSPRSYSLYTEASGALHFSTTSTVINDYVGTLSSGTIPLNEWVHVAAMVVDGQHQYYINGEPAGTSGSDIVLPGTTDTSPALIGRTGEGASRSFLGMIDDVRIYNEALTQEEIQVIMLGAGMPYASGPSPSDSVLHEDTWASLSWRPGDDAASHDVYFGENFNNVNDGAEGTFYGNQPSAFFVVGFPGMPYPDGLVPGTTYYWRIDELEADGTTKHKGNVWSFMVPPKTAYYPDPADGGESIDPDVELSWTAGFGAKLHYVYFGDNYDDVNSATGELPKGTTTYTPGTLKFAKTYYWRVDEFDAIETYKGDVWSFTTEGGVGSPDPSNGAVDVKHTPVLTWTPGFYAASHQVYFGTDKEAVRNADTSSPEYKGTGDLGSESYEAEKLEWNITYYWRIDEVNNTNPDSPWTGNVWSFTTANFLVVDDFEAYNDLDPAEADSNRIFNVWIDGYDDPTNGSLVGYDVPPFAEQTIVHGGNQSLPLYYDNSVGYSEATLTLTYPRDWTENGVSTLTIWFMGDSANAAETLYVALNGNAIVTNDNPNAAQTEEWTEWNIDLQAFADQGVNLANVNTIALGLGNKNNPQAGGSGTMYFDDIRLYPPPAE
ncbi:MAG TPA: LamG domain-containing protein [Sedimentisphaerales bacterium]|nr:LamG domain-containing protein [Sedimentisphaerales bacterium]